MLMFAALEFIPRQIGVTIFLKHFRLVSPLIMFYPFHLIFRHVLIKVISWKSVEGMVKMHYFILFFGCLSS